MSLKKRNKVNAEFNMSSLTDIIFLLLIFFMLTSSLVKVDVDLPEAEARTITTSSATVTINEQGNYSLNGREMSIQDLRSEIRRIVAEEKEKNEKDVPTITIAAEKNQPWDKVTEVMRIANELKIKAIIATKPGKKQ